MTGTYANGINTDRMKRLGPEGRCTTPTKDSASVIKTTGVK